MKLIKALVLIAFLSPSLWAGTDFVKNAQWSTYVTVISFYHRSYPNVYKPIELLPLDEIDQKTFEAEMNFTYSTWTDFQKTKKGSLADRQKEIKISREANERLLALTNSLKNKNWKVLKAVINTIPDSARLAMTPLDTLFWNSIIAAKAKEDFERTGVSIDNITEAKIKSEKGLITYTFSKPEGLQYKLRLINKSSDSLGVKGEFSGSRDPAFNSTAKDSSFKIYDLKGGFYDKNESELPFSSFPVKRDMFTGEDGKAHFAGDGHKHFY